jgi:hypothetical protein
VRKCCIAGCLLGRQVLQSSGRFGGMARGMECDESCGGVMHGGMMHGGMMHGGMMHGGTMHGRMMHGGLTMEELGGCR